MAAERGELDWDALAPFWHHFEERGFGSVALSWIEGGVVAPCLYLGAGLGTHALRLADTLGDPSGVIMVDASLAMLRRRRADREVPPVCADGRALPFRDASFATAVVATGVLEPEPWRSAVLGELVRVTRRAGAIIAAVLEPVPGQAPRDAWSGLDTWYRGTRQVQAFEAIADDLADRDAAYQLLRRSLPRFEATITAEALETAARSAGAMVTARLPIEGAVVLYRLTALT